MKTQRHLFQGVCAVAAVGLASCTSGGAASKDHSAARVAHWGYGVENGPDSWASMDSAWSLCGGGRQQSPIDLANATRKELPVATFYRPSEQEFAVLRQAGVVEALDNGHTIQVNAKTGETMSVGGKTYALKQFHFHAPSEHTVDGESFPMELHFVHQAKDGALAVVGVFVAEGAHNPGTARLWALLPEAPGTETTLRMPAADADHIFSGRAPGVYHYEGSLTTPPCSEAVQWYVRTTPTELSKDQIAAFTAVYDHNNRPVQAVNGRVVFLDPTLAVQERTERDQ